MPTSITYLGVGNIGAALVHTFLKARTAVTVWNRTAERANVRSVVEAGAIFEPDVAKAISKNDIIVICVLDYNAIYKVFSSSVEEPGILKGRTIINLTNGTPKQARELDIWLKERGVARYIDGAVMITPQLIGTEHSFLVLSGETEDVTNEIAQKYLAPAGRCLYRGTDVGASSLFDLAALAPMYGMFTGLFIAIGLLSRQKLPVPEGTVQDPEGGERPKIAGLVEQTVIPMMHALVPYLGLIAKSWDDSMWDDNLGNSVGMQLEGLKNIAKACDDEGVDGEGLSAITKLFAKIVDGYGENAGIAVGGKYMLQ
jgi:hypothetical protein